MRYGHSGGLFAFDAFDGLTGGVANLTDEAVTFLALGDALGRQAIPAFRQLPFQGEAVVAGDTVIEELQVLAHLRGGKLRRRVVRVVEHQVQDVGAGSGGGECGTRVMFLFKAVFDGILGEFGGGRGELRARADRRFGEEKVERVVIRVMGRIELIGKAEFVFGLAAEMAFERIVCGFWIGAHCGSLFQKGKEIPQPGAQ